MVFLGAAYVLNVKGGGPDRRIPTLEESGVFGLTKELKGTLGRLNVYVLLF